MRLPDEPELPLQINIVPLMDVILALLTFFIMSTLFLTRSEGLPVDLPRAKSAVSQQPTKITVTLNPKGQLFLNRQPVQLEVVEAQVRNLVEQKQQVLVVVNADEQVTHGQVITVMDRVRQIPGAKLAIATQRP